MTTHVPGVTRDCSDIDAVAGFWAEGPHPDLGDDLQLFGQFVGSWDLEVTLYDHNGAPTVVDGEWHFAWALEGRAVADVWSCPSRTSDDRRRSETGLTVRFPDPAIHGWRCTWIGPAYRTVHAFVARPVEDRIVLEGSFEPAVTTRWVFSDITPSSFEWRHLTSTGDHHGRLRQHFHAHRRSSPDRP